MELPDIPITPIPRRKGAGVFNRKLPLELPCASTPIIRIPKKVAKDGELEKLEKGKAASVLRQQNEASRAVPLKNLNQSKVENIIPSKLVGNKIQLVDDKPIASEAKIFRGGAETNRLTVKRWTGTQKTTESKVDAERKLEQLAKPRASSVAEGKDEEKQKGHLGSRAGGCKPLGTVVKVASKVNKGAEKRVRTDENVPSLAENFQKAVELSENIHSLSALHKKSTESFHKITKKSLQSTNSKQKKGSEKETDGELLTLHASGSKGLPSNNANLEAGIAKVSSNSDATTSKAETEKLTKSKSLDSRHSESKESKFRGERLNQRKSSASQTADSTNVVKTRVSKVSGQVNNGSTAEKELASEPTEPEVQIRTEPTEPEVPIRTVKSSAKVSSQGTTSQTSAHQTENSKRLTSSIEGSVFTNYCRSSSKGINPKAFAGNVKNTSMKPRAEKRRVASADVYNYCSNSTEAGHSADRTGPSSKSKKRRVVAEGSEEETSTANAQPEKRFLKHKILKPQKLLPNTLQEKAVKQAQHLNRRKSDERKEVELKVKPKIHQHWKTLSKATFEFAMGTLEQSFDEKFWSQKKTDFIDLVKCFEELKARMASELSLVRVPTSRKPIHYSALITQKASLESCLDESTMDVEQISNTVTSCKESVEKLKILKERLQSKRITASEVECLYNTSSQMSPSTVGSSQNTVEEAELSKLQEE